MDKTDTIIYIKNMVCPNCLLIIRNIFKQEDISIESIDWDKAAIKVDKFPQPYPEKVEKAIEPYGFKIISSYNEKVSEQIKITLIKWIYFSEEIVDNARLKELLESKFQTKYLVLDPLFKKINGYNIQDYFDLLRLERFKELLSYNENSFTEISLSLGFNDFEEIQHLVRTNLNCSISKFKKTSFYHRKPIDHL
jgi:YesN/AraC family two-component response regulator